MGDARDDTEEHIIIETAVHTLPLYGADYKMSQQ
jgi:hypothetical protein